MKCKACNAQLSKFDIITMKSDTLPEPEDLCQVCRGIAYSDEFLEVHEYQHEHLTENWVDFTVYNENTCK